MSEPEELIALDELGEPRSRPTSQSTDTVRAAWDAVLGLEPRARRPLLERLAATQAAL
jgi:hypothetical protein